MNAARTTIPGAVLSCVRGRAAVDVLLVVGASALIALAAQAAIPLPFTPVPLTMQPLAVLLVGVALGSSRGAAAATLYLLEGIGGLPVFAQGHGGAIWLVGPTAGRSEEHTSELQSPCNLVCRLLLEKKNNSIRPSLGSV